jgi:Tol biopolymer transport system component
VVFRSKESKLVSGDTNGYDDVFVHDRKTKSTALVSLANDGRQGNGYSGYPSISADGRFVAFISEATNLVTGDTNGHQDIFLRNRRGEILYPLDWLYLPFIVR